MREKAHYLPPKHSRNIKAGFEFLLLSGPTRVGGSEDENVMMWECICKSPNTQERPETPSLSES